MLLEMRDIVKNFYGNNVLKNVSMELEHGEIHALAGLNGAGKSTLANIISGVFPQDAGEMLLEGRRVELNNPAEALDAGIYTFYQAANYLPHLSVAENIFLRELPRKKTGFIDYKEMYARAEALFSEIGYGLDVRESVESLNLSQIYMMSLARALSSGAKLFIMDEPMINLMETEKRIMREFALRVRQQGKSIVYISHSISEILELCDKITVLRDGKRIADCRREDVDDGKLRYLISGNHALRLYPPKSAPQKAVLLETDKISVSSSLSDISIKLYSGEILGITGLTGSGGTMLVRSIFGDAEIKSGSILLKGSRLRLKSSTDALCHRFGYLSEDRLAEGLFMDMGISANMTITALNQIRKGFFIDLNREKDEVVDQSIELNLEFNSLNQEIRSLSGGNQQKVLVARSLMSRADVLLLDEPTKGIDIVSRSEIYIILHELAAAGKGIILVSADMEELAGMCHRVIVLKNGRQTAEVPGDSLVSIEAYG